MQADFGTSVQPWAVSHRTQSLRVMWVSTSG
jgi:hypothetical protein